VEKQNITKKRKKTSLKFKDNLDKFSVKAEVYKQEVMPVTRQNELENFRFEKWNESYIASADFKNYKADKTLCFLLPKEKNRQRKFVETENHYDKYFYINIDPELSEADKKRPEKVCIVWDASASALQKDLQKELALLDFYFKWAGSPDVELLVFSNDTEPVISFEIKNGDWTALNKHLKKITYDGGTQLGALNLTEYKCDEFILFSDVIIQILIPISADICQMTSLVDMVRKNTV